MSNKEIIQKALSSSLIGCYDSEMELLNKSNLKKVIDGLKYGGDTDVSVCINRKRYVVEICREGLDEVDFHVLTKHEYDERYSC